MTEAQQPEPGDVKLAELVREGDEHGLGAFYEAHAGAAHAYARRLCGPMAADDAMAGALAAAVARIRAGAEGPIGDLVGDAVRQEALARARDAQSDSSSQGRWRRRARPECQRTPALLAARASGRLSSSDEEHLERHLEHCPSCRELARRAREAESALNEASPAPGGAPHQSAMAAMVEETGGTFDPSAALAASTAAAQAAPDPVLDQAPEPVVGEAQPGGEAPVPEDEPPDSQGEEPAAAEPAAQGAFAQIRRAFRSRGPEPAPADVPEPAPASTAAATAAGAAAVAAAAAAAARTPAPAKEMGVQVADGSQWAPTAQPSQAAGAEAWPTPRRTASEAEAGAEERPADWVVGSAPPEPGEDAPSVESPKEWRPAEAVPSDEEVPVYAAASGGAPVAVRRRRLGGGHLRLAAVTAFILGAGALVAYFSGAFETNSPLDGNVAAPPTTTAAPAPKTTPSPATKPRRRTTRRSSRPRRTTPPVAAASPTPTPATPQPVATPRAPTPAPRSQPAPRRQSSPRSTGTTQEPGATRPTSPSSEPRREPPPG